MRKLYNDIIYFVQNHVKPVAPSNNYHHNQSMQIQQQQHFLSNQKAINHINHHQQQGYQQQQLIGYNQCANPKQGTTYSPPSKITSQTSVVTILEDNSQQSSKTKLFGVPLMNMASSKKRLHPDQYNGNNSSMDQMNKTRLVLGKDDLGLNLMPPC